MSHWPWRGGGSGLVLNGAQPCDGFASHVTPPRRNSQILFAQNPHPPVSNYQSNKKALLTAGRQRPQSSSASRRTAGAAGFLTFVRAAASGNRVVKSLSLRVKRPHVRGVRLRHLKVL